MVSNERWRSGGRSHHRRVGILENTLLIHHAELKAHGSNKRHGWIDLVGIPCLPRVDIVLRVTLSHDVAHGPGEYRIAVVLDLPSHDESFEHLHRLREGRNVMRNLLHGQ